MRDKKMISIIIVFLYSIKLFGQGRVDSDPILANIRWMCWKIDKDTSLNQKLISFLSQNGCKEIVAYYSKRDSLYKIVQLKGNGKGTEKITSYFSGPIPVFISVQRNNYSFTSIEKDYSKIVSSFMYIVDTIAVQRRLLYQTHYQASYYYDKRKLYYVNIIEGEKIRVNKELDKNSGILLFEESRQFPYYLNKY